MAFFYAARFFEKPGDAGRGKQAFESLGCAGCHDLAQASSQWQALADPIALLEAMWNHRAQMRAPPRPRASSCGNSARRILPTCWYTCAISQARPRANGRYSCRSRGLRRRRISIGRLRRVPSNGGGAGRSASKARRSPKSRPRCGITRLAWRRPAHPPSRLLPVRCVIWSAPFGRRSSSRMRAVRRRAAASSRARTARSATTTPQAARPTCPIRGTRFQRSQPWFPCCGARAEHAGSDENQGHRWPRFDGTQMADLIAYLNSKP
jgi:hypothetical protein